MAESPVLHLLAGLPGSGKTTHALQLERTGVVRLSVDDQLLAQHGQIALDYRVEDHVELLGPVVAQVHHQVGELLQSGTSVVFDHGLGLRTEREEMKRQAGECGAVWKLWSFQAATDVLLARLAKRSQQKPDSGVLVTQEMLRYLASVYQAPLDEGQVLISSSTV